MADKPVDNTTDSEQAETTVPEKKGRKKAVENTDKKQKREQA